MDASAAKDSLLRRQRDIAARLRERASAAQAQRGGPSFSPLGSRATATSPGSTAASSHYSAHSDDAPSEAAHSLASLHSLHDQERHLRDREGALSRAASMARQEVLDVNTQNQHLRKELNLADHQIDDLKQSLKILEETLRGQFYVRKGDADEDAIHQSEAGMVDIAAVSLSGDSKDWERLVAEHDGALASLREHQSMVLELEEQTCKQSQYISKLQRQLTEGHQQSVFAREHSDRTDLQTNKELAKAQCQIRGLKRDLSGLSFKLLMCQHACCQETKRADGAEMRVQHLQRTVDVLECDLSRRTALCQNFEKEVAGLNEQIGILKERIALENRSSSDGEDENLGSMEKRARELKLDEILPQNRSAERQAENDQNDDPAQKRHWGKITFWVVGGIVAVAVGYKILLPPAPRLESPAHDLSRIP
ncbi:hypothetical protein BSKO_00382 [Bryopsis sp. KO-2023]|nr:hypothetical protein BSKO_00382 [Bryopsis sp. KO-2023]